MALKCDNCGKGVQHGHHVSHAKNRTNRVFKPNLHKTTILVDKVKETMLLCSKCLKTVKKQAHA